MKQVKYNVINKSELFKGRNHVELDYNIPEHENFFFKRFGGKEYLKENYPLVYQAYEKTKTKMAEKSDISQNSNIDEPDMIDNAYGVLPITIRPLTNDEKLQLGRQDTPEEDYLTSMGWMHNQNPLPYVSLVGEMIDLTEGTLLDTFALFEKDKSTHHMENVLKYPSSSLIRKDDQQLQSNIEYYYIKDDGSVISEIIHSETYVFEGNDSIVSSITVSDPINKSGQENDPLIVLYGRTEQGEEKADYKYEDCKAVNDKVPIKLPLSGKITCSDTHYPIGLATGSHSTKIQLTFSDSGTIEYKHDESDLKKYFTVDPDDPHSLNFNLPEDWNDTLDTSHLSVKTELTLYAPIYIRIGVGSPEGPKRDIGVAINSEKCNSYDDYFKSTGSKVLIPKISVRWGCFAKDTRIRMADGSERQICDIKEGDLLYVPDQAPVRVSGIVIGEDEEKLVNIETESGKKIRVSKTHPIVTSNGIKQAENILTSDSILNEEGAPEAVRFVYLCEYNDRVYNLKTEGHAVILIGNGLQTGSYEMQCEVEGSRKEEAPKPLTPEVQALVEEMERLMKDTFQQV